MVVAGDDVVSKLGSRLSTVDLLLVLACDCSTATCASSSAICLRHACQRMSTRMKG